MQEFVKPNLFVSKCLEIDACRYNGQKIPNKFLARLFPFVNVFTSCPEVEIGLGIPRDTIRIVNKNDQRLLLQPTTGKDLTEKMNDFSHIYLSNVNDLDGFVLKSGSPSCGFKEVKIYDTTEKAAPIGKGPGFFGGEVVDRFSHLAIEDEGRLTNFRIREHFLTKLFTLARFRIIKESNSMGELVKFHSQNKYLLLTYNQTEMRKLGRIVANLEKREIADVMANYAEHLSIALSRIARYRANLNALQHGMGYFSKELAAQEKQYFLEMMKKYEEQKVPLSVCQGILKSWIVRFDQTYLMQQTYFDPFPEELVEITDSGKGRDKI